MTASCVIFPQNEAFTSEFSQTNMRLDRNNWLKQVVVVNSDLMNTLLLTDLSHKLKCVYTDFLKSHNHASLYLGWFHRAFMVVHAHPRSRVLEFLNPCFKSFPTIPLTSFRHSLSAGFSLWKNPKVGSPYQDTAYKPN